MEKGYISKIAELVRFRSANPYILGVDIGSSTLKILGVRISHRILVSFYSITKLPKDCDENYIIEAIRKVVRENRFVKKDAVICLGDEMVTLRRTELPHMAPNEIRDALKWQAVEMVRFDINKACIDFRMLGENVKEDGSRFMEVLFAAAPRDDIDKKARIVKKADCNVVAAGVGPFGLENILKLDDNPESARTTVVVDYGNKKTEISVYKNRVLEFSRSVNIGSRDIADAISANPIVTGAGKVSYTPEEAEAVKESLGISYDESTLPDGVTSMQILALIRPTLEWLSKEVKRSIDYYLQEYDSGPIALGYVTGGGANLKNLDRYLGEETGIQFKKMAVPKSVDTSRVALKEDDAPYLLPLLGVVLGHKGRPNLLPQEYISEKIEIVEKISLRMVAFAVGIVLLASFLSMKLTLDNYEYRLKNLRFQNTVLGEIKLLQDKVMERSAFLRRARESDISVERLMKRLSNAVPEAVILSEMRIGQDDKSLEMKGIVRGSSSQAEAIMTKFMEEMEESRCFKDAQLVSLQDAETDGQVTSFFEISCLLE